MISDKNDGSYYKLKNILQKKVVYISFSFFLKEKEDSAYIVMDSTLELESVNLIF